MKTKNIPLVFATNNNHKINEIKNIIDDTFEILGLKDIGCYEELPEHANTLEGNALQKSGHVFQNYGYECFSEDTGLEVKALNGQPGVFSARYGGPGKDSQQNIIKLLREMQGIQDRSAQFRTVISYISKGQEIQFEGIVKGTIANDPSGSEGFGYDPVFIPEGYNITFANMPVEEKNTISHRYRAMKKFIHFLSNKTK